MNRTLVTLTSTLALFALVGCASPKKLMTAYAEIDRLETKVEVLEAAQNGHVVQIDQLQAELAAMVGKNEELAAMFGAYTSEMAGFEVTGDSEVVLFHDRAAMPLDEGILFASGSATLSAEGQKAVDAIARVIRQHPDRHYAIEGHTDPRPIQTAQYGSNWELGAARAVAVVHALIDRGIAEQNLSAVTYAANQPVGTELAANRRISVAFEMSPDEQVAWAKMFDRMSADRAWEVAAVEEEPAAEEPAPDLDTLDEAATPDVETTDGTGDRERQPFPGTGAWVPPAEDALDVHLP